MGSYEQKKFSLQDEFEKMHPERWSAKQKRLYHRMSSLLIYWESHDYQMLRIDLTSSYESNPLELRINHIKLRKMVEKKFGYEGIEDIVVETTEGNGVLHCVWAWRPQKGCKYKNFTVPYWWLSMAWICLHRAWKVYIQRYDKESFRSRKRVSRYVVTQYIGGQSQLKRYSYSWHRTFDFGLVTFWKKFKIYWLYHARVDYKEMIWLWEKFLSGERLPDLENKGRWFLRIDEMRGVEIL